MLYLIYRIQYIIRMKKMHFHRPFWFRMPQAIPRGFLKHYILKLLSDRPMHGYEIMDEVEKRSNGFWRPSAGSIYPTLTWLEDRGLIEEVPSAEKERGKKAYRITERGQGVLKESMKHVEEISNRISCLGAFWWDFLRKGVRPRFALQRLKRASRHLREGVKYIPEEDLKQTRLTIENIRKELDAVSKEIDNRIGKKK